MLLLPFFIPWFSFSRCRRLTIFPIKSIFFFPFACCLNSKIITYPFNLSVINVAINKTAFEANSFGDRIIHQSYSFVYPQTILLKKHNYFLFGSLLYFPYLIHFILPYSKSFLVSSWISFSTK